MPRRTPRRLLVTAALALTLAACGESTPQETGGSATGGSGTAAATPACESRPATAEPPAGVSTDLAVAPEVPASDTPPPCGLVTGDVVVGTGPEAVAGSPVAVKYVGAFYETGEQFDSSWSRGADETLPVTLGQGRVIPGFEQGIAGMRVGGRRMVTIPSDLAYGPQGQGPIPGGATLVFVLDLVSAG
ncbi:FKBP-type peptidyl-prolyl cis-trans isomerase [Geodermatophilus obscurus]|uniref:Peptidyl-prolyl cis-trans isomerase n=1 Tax=Geodermatophilus obscurus TaxID=1861 RepID=A0A1I5EMB5_9ACTN|nr:FKBP-type peptidyl-prolyl cis-trans isomerase [Geodermatophilus obscurus]SFO12664.1 FKBP-type peptidyl-prolyl cis-trans isomerase [Geodermatophilus obscurus]